MKKAIALLCLIASHAAGATVTGYCPCTKCCGRGANGLAANGKPPIAGVTIAGPRRYPLGTRVLIEGLGERVITDRTAKRFDNRFDIFFPTHAEAKRFGIRQLTVTVLK